MAGKSFQVLSTSEAEVLLDELHNRVSEYNDRVDITCKGSKLRCVLISQAELEGLEKAVEILSETNDGVAMREEVLRIAMATEVLPDRAAV